MKKLLAIVLAICCLFSVVAISASADGEATTTQNETTTETTETPETEETDEKEIVVVGTAEKANAMAAVRLFRDQAIPKFDLFDPASTDLKNDIKKVSFIDAYIYFVSDESDYRLEESGKVAVYNAEKFIKLVNAHFVKAEATVKANTKFDATKNEYRISTQYKDEDKYELPYYMGYEIVDGFFNVYYKYDKSNILMVKANCDGALKIIEVKKVNFAPDTIITTFFNDNTDVADWFYDDVNTMGRYDIFSGYGSTYKYGPADNIMRQDLVLAIARAVAVRKGITLDELLSSAKVSSADFTDVNTSAYYAKAVAWACENGIVKGYANGKFGVGDFATREQIAAFICRALKYLGYSIYTYKTADRFAEDFNGFDKVDASLMNEVAYCLQHEIITGQGTTKDVDAKSNTNRAEIAAMLVRTFNF